MNASTKYANLQAYRLVLYRRALHPEFFPVKGRRLVSYGDYDFEAWVMPGAHLMRFQYDGSCATEVVTGQEDGLPERGLVAAAPCAGEKDHEHAFTDKLTYLSTVQTETLPENLYNSTYKELTDFAAEREALTHYWNDPEGGKCASIVDVQRFRREIHAQAYHLLCQGGIVLRSQSIFEHK